MKTIITLTPALVKKFRAATIAKTTLHRVLDKTLEKGVDTTSDSVMALTQRVIDADLAVEDVWDEVLDVAEGAGLEEGKSSVPTMGIGYRTVSFANPDPVTVEEIKTIKQIIDQTGAESEGEVANE